MSQPYPAADLVAPQVHAHFSRHHAEPRARGSAKLAALPSVEAIAVLVDAAFWASLRHEEGYVAKIPLAFLSQEDAAKPMIFERALPLNPASLAKVAPAVERAGIHLGVWPSADAGGALRVWGTSGTTPPLCFVLEVAGPGLLVVKYHRGDEASKFINVAVLEGDQVKFIDEQAANLPDCPSLLSSLLDVDSPASWSQSVNVLVQLAVSMRAHGRGGSLLVVPAAGDAWRESIVHPIAYAATPRFTALADLHRAAPSRRAEREWQDALARAIAAVAGLTAVDGATIISTDYELLGFGAKITRREGGVPVSRVSLTEPIVGGEAAVVEPAHLGGTRHLSAAQFVHDQRDTLALVASQDGHFTIFAWSACNDLVHAHRIETLLL